jgi:hypothetical protein
MSFGDDNPFVFGVLRRSALGWRDEHLAAGKRRSGPRLRVDGRGGQSRLNRGSPMLNAQRPTTPQQEPGMAGAEEPPIMGPADPIPASGAGQRFSLDRIASTSYRTDLAVPVASRGRVRR